MKLDILVSWIKFFHTIKLRNLSLYIYIYLLKYYNTDVLATLYLQNYFITVRYYFDDTPGAEGYDYPVGTQVKAQTR